MKKLALGILFCAGALSQAASNVAPYAINLSTGMIVMGSVNDLAQDDAISMIFRPGPVLISSQSPLSFTLRGFSPMSNLQMLRVRVDSTGSSNNLAERVEAFNYSTNSYVTIGNGPLPLANHHVDVTLPSPNDYKSSSGDLLLRLSYRTTGVVIVYPWTVSVDRAIWQID